MATKIGEKLAKRAKPKTGPAHLIVEARAGTGKTTTLIEGLKRMRGIETRITPSDQQAAIWDAMAESKDAKTICFVAFNKSIATELQARVPAGCEAMTMHSMGFKAVNKLGRFRVSEYRVQDLLAKELGVDSRELRKEQPVLLGAVKELVGLCKVNLKSEPTPGDLSDLAENYGVELNGSRAQVFDLVPKILARCRDPFADGCIDFDDMIWLPVVLNLPLFRYDLLLVDEAQDLNRCQQELAKRCGSRLILCGDPKQAIYGFAGADSESMGRMFNELKATAQGCHVLPLTVTRRCGKAIVREANKIVKDFSAFETNPDGVVAETKYPTQKVNGSMVEMPEAQTYLATVQPGDMVVCRTNAPLVRQCFKLIKRGTRATIQGRDIGKGLIALVTKMKAETIPALVTGLGEWLTKERDKENAKRNPSEAKIQALEDRHDCLMCFVETCDSIPGVIAKIEAMFTDDKTAPGVRLSSVHKAKGLESRTVYYMKPACLGGFGGSRERQPWEYEQERNLEYVAITRAIEKLVYVY